MKARRDNKRARLATTDSYEIEDLETDSLFDNSMFEDDEGQLDRVDTERPAKRYKRHRHPAADEEDRQRSSISEGDYVQYRDNKKGKVLGIFVYRSLQDIRRIFLYISPSLPLRRTLVE
ncbi:hypothetical protein V8E54_014847 [Elaphomyces granulatus]